jgi:hypothetical protein
MFYKSFRNATLQALAFEIPGISNWNRFVRIELAFGIQDLKSPIKPYGFKLTVSRSNRTSRSDSVVEFVDLQFRRASVSNFTDSKVCFDDRVISYEYLNVMIHFPDALKSSFNATVATVVIGSPEHTLYQIYYRGIYTFAEFGLFVVFLVRGFKKDLRPEQILTMFLLFVGVIANNPFEFLSVKMFVRLLFDAIARSVFHGFVIAASILLFDFLQQPKSYDVLNGIAFGMIGAGLECFCIVQEIWELQKNPFIGEIPMRRQLKLYEQIYTCVLCIQILVRTGKAFCSGRHTEGIRLLFYIGLALSVVVNSVLVRIGERNRNWFPDAEISWMTNFTLNNAFVLVMGFVHSPHEPGQEDWMVHVGAQGAEPENDWSALEQSDPGIKEETLDCT